MIRFPLLFQSLRRPVLIAGGVLLLCAAVPVKASGFKFDFNSPEAPPVPGFTRVTPQTAYDARQGYGFLANLADTTKGPPTVRVFAVDVPEGNYDVTVRFGDPAKATSTTLKAESYRLMVEKVETAPGNYETRAFTVNVRRPAIGTGGEVLLDRTEKGPPPVPDWDDHLTFEIHGENPGLASLEIRPAPDAITVFLAGDSTVTDQIHAPYAAWGQMLPRFFQSGIALSNQAESGLTLSTFKNQKRLDKVLSMMRRGDYLFIQFGHNDQRDKAPNAGPFTTYKANLKDYVEAAKAKGGLPVLVTPMARRTRDARKQGQRLEDYAEAMRQVGKEEAVPVIDLNAMSTKFYAALGPQHSTEAFVYYPAGIYPEQKKKALHDDTHHNVYGAYELARCVVEGIKASVPELAKYLAKDAGTFDPSHPDPVQSVDVPQNPVIKHGKKPAGS